MQRTILVAVQATDDCTYNLMRIFAHLAFSYIKRVLAVAFVKHL